MSEKKVSDLVGSNISDVPFVREGVEAKLKRPVGSSREALDERYHEAVLRLQLLSLERLMELGVYPTLLPHLQLEDAPKLADISKSLVSLNKELRAANFSDCVFPYVIITKQLDELHATLGRLLKKDKVEDKS